MAEQTISYSLDTYLVGGAVRDQLLSRDIIERDYVVVGSTVEQMIELGFTQVGKDFPVFLHPKTKEEYALARTEKKQGQGYTGFVCHASPDISLEQDLLRRDLTVNAMALSHTGELFDPFNGQRDLINRILRHVSPAFEEDPLRVLRVARFAARYHYLGFKVADETLQLMTKISNSGELATLSAERVWQEIAKTLSESNPEVFFKVLHTSCALQAIWPELDALWMMPHPVEQQTEICSGIHTMTVLQKAVKLSPKVSVRFAALCHDLGKAVTPTECLDIPPNIEPDGITSIERACVVFKIPNKIKSLALKVYQFRSQCHQALELSPQTILQLLDKLDVWRKPDEFDDFLIACQASVTDKLGLNETSYPQGDYLKKLYSLCLAVSPKVFVKQGLKGFEIKQAMQNEKLAIIKDNLRT